MYNNKTYVILDASDLEKVDANGDLLALKLFSLNFRTINFFETYFTEKTY